MFALVEPTGRIAQIEKTKFPVAAPIKWVSAPDWVTTEHVFVDGAFVAPKSVPQDVPAAVSMVALRKKIEAVNALVTDGSVISNAQELATKEASILADMMMLIDAKMNAGGKLPQDKQATLDRAKQGHTFLKSVDTAAQTIIEAGDVTDPISEDPRWPTLSTT